MRPLEADRETAVAVDEHGVVREAEGAQWGESIGVTYERLREELGKAMSPELHLRVVLEVLKALQPVHTNLLRPPAQRCHGTLNPSCIVINSEGTLSLYWQPMTRPTREQRPYLAPEVRSGLEADQQADIYSVGLMLYEVVTGRRVTGATPDRNQPAVVAWADPLLDVAIEALYRSPARRWASARAFAEGVEALSAGHVATRQELADTVRGLCRDSHAAQTAILTVSAAERTLSESGITPTALRSASVSLPVSAAVSGEVFAVASPSVHPPGASASSTRPVRHSGMWFSAHRTPGFAWLGLTAAAVLTSLLVGFWLGTSNPAVPVVAPTTLQAEPDQDQSKPAGQVAKTPSVDASSKVAKIEVPPVEPLPTTPEPAAAAEVKAPAHQKPAVKLNTSHKTKKPTRKAIGYEPEGI